MTQMTDQRINFVPSVCYELTLYLVHVKVLKRTHEFPLSISPSKEMLIPTEVRDFCLLQSPISLLSIEFHHFFKRDYFGLTDYLKNLRVHIA